MGEDKLVKLVNVSATLRLDAIDRRSVVKPKPKFPELLAEFSNPQVPIAVEQSINQADDEFISGFFDAFGLEEDVEETDDDDISDDDDEEF